MLTLWFLGNGASPDDNECGALKKPTGPEEPDPSHLKHKQSVDAFDKTLQKEEKKEAKDPHERVVRAREHYANHVKDRTMHNGLSGGVELMEAGGHPNFGIDGDGGWRI